MGALQLAQLSSLRAFGSREFSAVWLGALISTLGTWMETIALGVYVTHTTGRAEWTGGIVALNFLPSLVLSPLGGALADRFDCRASVAAGTLVNALLAGVLTVLAATGRLSVQAVALVALLHGCVSNLTGPAFVALLTGLVPAEALHSAVSLNSAQYNVGRVLGPVLAAVVLEASGLAWALLLNTLSFVAVLVALARVRSPVRPAPARESLWAGILRGMRVARGDEGVRLALVTTLAVAALVAPFIGLIPVMAIRVFHQGAAATSLLVSAQGLGAVCAVVVVGSLLDRLGRRRLLEWTLGAMGLVAVLYWLAPTLPLAATAIFLLGGAYVATLTNLNTAVQARAPRELQARVASLYYVVLSTGYAVGVWLQGALADRLGVRLVTVGASLLFLAGVLTVRTLRPQRFAVLEG